MVVRTLQFVKKNSYKSVQFCYYSPLRDLIPVRYIRKFVIFEFVVTVSICKNLIRILPGT